MPEVPVEVLAAAQTVGRWCKEQNIKDWAIGDCASRPQLERLHDALTRIRTEDLSRFDCILIAAEAQGLFDSAQRHGINPATRSGVR